MQDISLNPNIDLQAARETYAKTGIVQIADIFDAATAERIAKSLEEKRDWRLVFADPQHGIASVSEAQLRAMDSATRQTVLSGVQTRAARNIGFLYLNEVLTAPNGSPLVTDPDLSDLINSLQSRPFLDFGAEIIAETDITHIEAQATKFQPGHFLTRHIDEGQNNTRRAAFTLGFSKQWQTDWGGQLQLIDKMTTDVTAAFIPRFNTLTIFDGRIVHAVSQVASFAPTPRLSVVGWLRRG